MLDFVAIQNKPMKTISDHFAACHLVTITITNGKLNMIFKRVNFHLSGRFIYEDLKEIWLNSLYIKFFNVNTSCFHKAHIYSSKLNYRFVLKCLSSAGKRVVYYQRKSALIL